MFENLTGRLTSVLNKLSSKGRLTDRDIDEALTEVRRSLLEADVNFRVARDFVATVKDGPKAPMSWKACLPASR